MDAFHKLSLFLQEGNYMNLSHFFRKVVIIKFLYNTTIVMIYRNFIITTLRKKCERFI